MKKDAKKAIVLAGGGAWGAYQVGSIKAMMEQKVPRLGYFEPQIFTGTSIGSFNASYLVSHWDVGREQVIYDLEQVWFEQMAESLCSNGGYRIRFNPLHYLPHCVLANPRKTIENFVDDTLTVSMDSILRLPGLFNSEQPFPTRLINLFNISTFISPKPWDALIARNIDFTSIATSSRDLSVVATNWNNGSIKIFHNHNVDTLEAKAIIASSALPGFYPTETIGPDEYVDGGVLMNTPLKPAIKQDATEIEVISMIANIWDMPLQEPPSSVESLFRMELITWEAAINRDIERVRSYNRAVDLLVQLGNPKTTEDLTESIAALKDNSIDLNFKGLTLALSLLQKQHYRLQNGKPPKDYRHIVIHRFFPKKPLGGPLSLLKLNRGTLESYSQLGYNDALHHDCEADGCVL